MLWELAENDLLHSRPEFAVIDKKKLQEKYLPLVFIAIGIEALIRENDPEHAHLGRTILNKIISKHIDSELKFNNQRDFDIDLLDL